MISILLKTNFHCFFAHWLVRATDLEPRKSAACEVWLDAFHFLNGYFWQEEPFSWWRRLWAPGPDHCSKGRLHSPTISTPASPCQREQPGLWGRHRKTCMHVPCAKNSWGRQWLLSILLLTWQKLFLMVSKWLAMEWVGCLSHFQVKPFVRTFDNCSLGPALCWGPYWGPGIPV